MSKRRLVDQEFALGLTWLAPGASSARAGKSKILKELNSIKPAPCGFVEIDTPSGIQVGALSQYEDVGLESAAARLAISRSSAVVIEQLSENEYWLCAVEEGSVFPAGDIVGDKNIIENRLQEIQSDISGTDIRLFEKHGNFSGIEAHPLGFYELISQHTPDKKPICKPIEQSHLKKHILTAAVAGLLAAGAIGIWLMLSKAEHDSVTDVSIAERNAVDLEREKRLLQQTLAQNAPALLASMTDMIFERPLRANGWRNSSYEWHTDKITAIWQREHGDFALISSYLENKPFNFNESTGGMVENMEFPAQQLEGDFPLDSLSSIKDQRLELMDILAQLPGQWTLGPPQVKGNLFKYQRSKLSGSSAKLADAIYAAQSFVGYPLQITRIKFNLGQKFKWQIEGAVYAKHD